MVEVMKFHKKGLKPPIKKVMSYGEFSELKSKDYYYRAFQIGYNTTLI